MGEGRGVSLHVISPFLQIAGPVFLCAHAASWISVYIHLGKRKTAIPFKSLCTHLKLQGVALYMCMLISICLCVRPLSQARDADRGGPTSTRHFGFPLVAARSNRGGLCSCPGEIWGAPWGPPLAVPRASQAPSHRGGRR